MKPTPEAVASAMAAIKSNLAAFPDGAAHLVMILRLEPLLGPVLMDWPPSDSVVAAWVWQDSQSLRHGLVVRLDPGFNLARTLVSTFPTGSYTLIGGVYWMVDEHVGVTAAATHRTCPSRAVT